MNVNDRFKILIADLKANKKIKTQKELGVLLGFETESAFSQVVNNKVPFSETLYSRINSLYNNVNIDWLRTGEGSMLKEEKQNIIPQGELKSKEYSHTLQVRLVTNKAKAGWSDGYYNDEYLEDMPFIIIDADENHKGKYLAFEVAGDSMEPDYMEGDIVICREIQRHLWNYKLHFKDWDFVIAHYTQGIMLKEIVEHNVETGDIVCRSLNPKHEDFILNLREVSFLYNVVEVRQKGRKKRWNRAKDFFE